MSKFMQKSKACNRHEFSKVLPHHQYARGEGRGYVYFKVNDVAEVNAIKARHEFSRVNISLRVKARESCQER